MSYFRIPCFLVNKWNGRFNQYFYGQLLPLRHFNLANARTKEKTDLYWRPNQENGEVTSVIDSEKKIIKNLVTHLNCSLKDAELLFKDNSKFLLHNIKFVNEGIYVLKQNRISQTAIVQNFWILYNNPEELKLKLNLIKKWKFNDLPNGIPVLKLSIMKLMKYTSQTESEFKLFNSMNRISYFSSFVKCDENRASQLFMKYNFMMVLRAESFKKILTMVKDQGILTEDLLSDLWVFRYSPRFISIRIKRLEEIGAKDKCDVIKPWMLRCTNAILNRYFELKEENMMALGVYSDLKDLLSNELDLTAEQVDEMIAKHPPLANISYSKAREMIEFLKAEGFDTKMIYHVPRVLCHKQATLVARMIELKRIAPNLMNLQNLCRNKKDYDSFLNKMTA